MIKIKIIALGKLKEPYLRDAVKEYEKRLSRFCSLQITELEPERLPDSPAASEIEAALKKEADIILKNVPEGAVKVALCIEGNQLSSEELTEKIFSLANAGKGSFVFIIGSSHGLHTTVKNAADIKLSFSKMTFPHQIARIILLEQVYRAFQINAGGPYHK